jgi:hypothetical protein
MVAGACCGARGLSTALTKALDTEVAGACCGGRRLSTALTKALDTEVAGACCGARRLSTVLTKALDTEVAGACCGARRLSTVLTKALDTEVAGARPLSCARTQRTPYTGVAAPGALPTLMAKFPGRSAGPLLLRCGRGRGMEPL